MSEAPNLTGGSSFETEQEFGFRLVSKTTSEQKARGLRKQIIDELDVDPDALQIERVRVGPGGP